jgi:hypothetical protein
MCVYVVVFVGCCCICGGPHLTRLSLRAAAWDSRNPLQFANELSVKAHAGRQPRANSPKPSPVAILCARIACAKRARSRFLWWACFMPPKGKKQQQGNNPSSSQMSNERFINAPYCPVQPSRHMPPPPLRPLLDDVRVRRAALKQHHLLYT